MIKLRTHPELSWRGTPIPGARLRALFSALIERAPRECSSEELISLIWDDAAPLNPKKALQVLVARARKATVPRAIISTAAGYRLGLDADSVDVLAARTITSRAEEAFDSGDVSRATALLDELIQADVFDASTEAQRLRALISSYSAKPRAALCLLRTELAAHPTDEELRAAFLRATARVHGPAHALAQYSEHRARLRSEFGLSPGPLLQRVERELLNADEPIRSGLASDSGEFLGRETDLANIHRLLEDNRVVSIIGTGGLGKTRLAQAVGRSTALPVVHFIDLTTVRKSDDLLAEIMGLLRLRAPSESAGDSSTARAAARTLVARHLERAPTLLIVDNCEHVLDEVADLLSPLLAATENLRVLATSRAALNIAAERRYLLSALDLNSASKLFQVRARDLRASVRLSKSEVEHLVTALEGLPLAIELAAAKTRYLSVAQITARLTDRFELLRGGTRSGPARHQTMSAVLDWSWNLLSDAQQRVLSRFALLPDGFSLEVAESLIPSADLAALENLVDQSLLTVTETVQGVRYRMFESVREFAIQQLEASPEQYAAALAARTEWAAEYARGQVAALHTGDQITAMRTVQREEVNLTETAQHAIDTNDAPATFAILAGLVWYWVIAGKFQRVLSFFQQLEARIATWRIPASAVEDARTALTGLWILRASGVPIAHANLRAAFVELGPARSLAPVGGFGKVLLALDSNDLDLSVKKLEEFSEESDPNIAVPALQGLAHLYENNGDPRRATEVIERSLARTDALTRPWPRAMQIMLLAQLYVQLGDYETAQKYAAEVHAVLNDLGSYEEMRAAQAIFAVAALHRRDYETAERELEILEGYEKRHGYIDTSIAMIGWAELALARGDIERGLALYDEWLERGIARDLPESVRVSEFAPWVLFAQATTLVAAARFGTAGRGNGLFRELWEKLANLAEHPAEAQDYPALGMVLFATGTWGLLRGGLPARQAVRLLGLAKAMSYNRISPSMAWEEIIAPAEAAAPGLLAEMAQQTQGLWGRDLIPELQRVLAS